MKGSAVPRLALLFLCAWAVFPCDGAEGRDRDFPAVAELSLTFSGGGDTLVSRKGDVFQAVATAVVEGAGILEGGWSVAGPLAQRGGRDYQALSVFRHLVDPQGEEGLQEVVFRSPKLPSALEGNYIVRIVFREQDGGDIKSEIRYFVGETPFEDQLAPGAPVPEKLETAGPSGGEAAGPDSVFSWPSVPGSVAYQLELFDRTGEEKGIPMGEFNTCLVRTRSSLDRPPLAGLMLPGYRNETRLHQLAGGRLTEGKSYLWRVISLDTNGRSLCESPFKEFRYTGGK